MKAYINGLASMMAVSVMATLSVVIPLTVLPAESRAVKYSVSEQLQEVGSSIDQAESQGLLSNTKAEQLRTQQSKITNEQNKLKAERGGALTYSDIDYFETELVDLNNKISKERK